MERGLQSLQGAHPADTLVLYMCVYIYIFFFFKINLFIFGLGLHCCEGFSLVAASRR